MNLIVSILMVGLLIALHEAGHFITAKKTGMTVLRFSIGLLHAIASWTSKKSGTIYQIGMLPFGGFVQIKGMNPFEKGALEDVDSYQLKPVWKRALVIISGPAANLLTAWVLLTGLYMSGHQEPVDEPRVGYTVADAPADRAGIVAGDRIVEFNGEKMTTWTQLVTRLHANPEKEVTLFIERGKERIEFKVTPENKGGIGLIGIGQPTKTVHLPVHVSAGAAAIKCTEVIGGIVGSLFKMIIGSETNMQTVGPVGIVKMAATTLDTGVKQFLGLTAYLSLMLFLFNLLPLPALDGGRGVFLLWEIVTRRRVNPKVDAITNTVGFLLLIGLLVVVTFKELFLD